MTNINTFIMTTDYTIENSQCTTESDSLHLPIFQNNKPFFENDTTSVVKFFNEVNYCKEFDDTTECYVLSNQTHQEKLTSIISNYIFDIISNKDQTLTNVLINSLKHFEWVFADDEDVKDNKPDHQTTVGDNYCDMV